MIKILQTNLHVIHKLWKQRGCTRRSPIVLQIRICQGIDETERIEDINHIAATEVIAVIISRKLRNCFIECPVFVFSQLIDFRLEIT